MNEDLARYVEQGNSESNAFAHKQHDQEQDNLCGENGGKRVSYHVKQQKLKLDNGGNFYCNTFILKRGSSIL